MELVRRLAPRTERATDAVTLDDVVRCARPIHFEIDDEEIRYAGSGSGFFAVRDHDWFLFTANHVVGRADPRSVRVLPTDGAHRWILIDRQVTGRSLIEGDTDLIDVRCFHIDTSDLQIPLDEQMLGLDLAFPIGAQNPGDKLLIAGYPGVSREIDYDDRRIQAVGQTVWGRYLGKDPSRRSHEMELTDLGGIDCLDGFSGSPVFSIGDQRDDLATVRLAGMVIRGNAASRRAHFVEAGVFVTFARARLGMPAYLSGPADP